jgi:hypothetical protein
MQVNKKFTCVQVQFIHRGEGTTECKSTKKGISIDPFYSHEWMFKRKVSFKRHTSIAQLQNQKDNRLKKSIKKGVSISPSCSHGDK